MDIRTSLYLPSKLVAKLKALAKADGRSASKQLAHILRRFFARGKKRKSKRYVAKQELAAAKK